MVDPSVPSRNDAVQATDAFSVAGQTQAAHDALPMRRVDPQAKLVQMLVNPCAGSSSKKLLADEITSALAEAGYEVQRLGSPDELRDASHEVTSSGSLRCVVGLGGDGTLGAMLNMTPPGVPLAIVPQGTENLMAGYLRMTRRASDLVRLIEEGQVIDLDAGVANGRLFSLMASVGFDADVVRRVHERRLASGGGNISHLAYAQPILEAMGGYEFPQVRITPLDADGRDLEPVEGTWVFAVNLPRYASGLRIVPWADGVDGQLDLCVFQRGQTHAGLWYLWHVLRGRHQMLESVVTRRVRSCRIEAVDGAEAPYQIDGDPGGFLPLELGVAPGRMALLATRSTAARLASEWRLANADRRGVERSSQAS